jgi:hypothetical protein
MAGGPSLYEMLTGCISDESLDAYDENTQEILSVMAGERARLLRAATDIGRSE